MSYLWYLKWILTRIQDELINMRREKRQRLLDQVSTLLHSASFFVFFSYHCKRYLLLIISWHWLKEKQQAVLCGIEVRERKGKTGAGGLEFRVTSPRREDHGKWEKTFNSEFDKCGQCKRNEGPGLQPLVKEANCEHVKYIKRLMKQPDACESCGGRPRPNHGLKLTSSTKWIETTQGCTQ